ncbi:unnamed protein product [Pylaiella littoralis]
MGFFGMVLKPGQKEAVEVPPGWCLQLCTAALEPAKVGVQPRDVSATLWVQVEGEIGDTSYLLGSLQGGGPCAQIPVGHCLTSVDGEVIIEAKGAGTVHLTGFFNREYDPDLEHDDESSDEESSQEDSDLGVLLAEYIEGEDDEEEEEEEDEEEEMGSRSLSNGTRRSKRSAAAAAALACGTGGGEEDSEDDSEVDGEYVPGEGDDEDDDGDGDDSGDGGDMDDEDEEEEEEEEKEKKNTKNDKKRAASAGGADTPAASPSSGQQRPPKKSRQAAAAAAAAAAATGAAADAGAVDEAAAAQPNGQEADGGDETNKSEMTKQERRRQRKRENKRKAAEAKKGLEDAFRAMDPEEGGEPPVGIPLKNPRTKTLKGGLKIKDTTFGGGKMAVPGKNIKVCYEGCFPDGRVFDKNNNRRRPLQFRVGMQKVIAGMDRGVEGMRVGGSREIAIPAALGYGARGTGPIPANQDLVFRVELIDVLGK